MLLLLQHHHVVVIVVSVVVDTRLSVLQRRRCHHHSRILLHHGRLWLCLCLHHGRGWSTTISRGRTNTTRSSTGRNTGTSMFKTIATGTITTFWKPKFIGMFGQVSRKTRHFGWNGWYNRCHHHGWWSRRMMIRRRTTTHTTTTTTTTTTTAIGLMIRIIFLNHTSIIVILEGIVGIRVVILGMMHHHHGRSATTTSRCKGSSSCVEIRIECHDSLVCWKDRVMGRKRPRGRNKEYARLVTQTLAVPSTKQNNTEQGRTFQNNGEDITV
jgi:hypothetical protein